MNNMQALMDGMSAQWQSERAETQMTLGGMITTLEAMPKEAEIQGISEPDSYRGYYSDLAFKATEGKIKVADALEMCRAAMGKVFTGYKGGDYMMGELTPLWLADYGCCGKKIMAIGDNGVLETEEDD